MTNHNWIPSTLGHGRTMCTYCKITDREASALNVMNHCDSAPVVDETKPDINKDWKVAAQANAVALNILYEYVGANVGPIPAQEHMECCAVDPVVLVKHIIETIQNRLALNDGKRIAELEAALTEIAENGRDDLGWRQSTAKNALKQEGWRAKTKPIRCGFDENA